jgi:hypothetical protein
MPKPSKALGASNAEQIRLYRRTKLISEPLPAGSTSHITAGMIDGFSCIGTLYCRRRFRSCILPKFLVADAGSSDAGSAKVAGKKATAKKVVAKKAVATKAAAKKAVTAKTAGRKVAVKAMRKPAGKKVPTKKTSPMSTALTAPSAVVQTGAGSTA